MSKRKDRFENVVVQILDPEEHNDSEGKTWGELRKECEAAFADLKESYQLLERVYGEVADSYVGAISCIRHAADEVRHFSEGGIYPL